MFNSQLPPIEDTSDKKRVVGRIPSLEKCLEDEKRRTHALTEKNAILVSPCVSLSSFKSLNISRKRCGRVGVGMV